MLGVIIGDVIGSRYEREPIKTTDFPLFRAGCRFTDDTVLTVATAEAILTGTSYGQSYREYARRYPNAGYGAMFYNWMQSDHSTPYNSWGNGSGMRVAPVGFAFSSAQNVLREAMRSAEVTHDHDEGIKGAQAIALTVHKARTGATKEQIRRSIARRFGYDLARTLDSIRPTYQFDVSCQGSVPEAILAFLESDNFEHAIRLAVSLGGDSDTIAAMTGGIAQAFYGEIPTTLVDETLSRLPPDFVDVVNAFERQFSVKR
jgi:ADP-ribosylglycohydrolase